jgi:hypothetical protein
MAELEVATQFGLSRAQHGPRGGETQTRADYTILHTTNYGRLLGRDAGARTCGYGCARSRCI